MNKIINNYLEQIYNTNDVIKRTNVSCGIIFKEQRGQNPALLLIQRSKKDHWPNFWESPRGGCNDEESILDGLRREVKEEAGIDIIPLKFIDKFQYIADKGTRLSTQYNFLCKMKDPDQPIKISKEHQDVKWVTSVGEVELMVLPELKKSIAKAFALINSEDQIFNNPLNDFTPTGMIEEQGTPMQGVGLALASTAAMGAGAAMGTWYRKRKCAKLHPNDLDKQKSCSKFNPFKKSK